MLARAFVLLLFPQVTCVDLSKDVSLGATITDAQLAALLRRTPRACGRVDPTLLQVLSARRVCGFACVLHFHAVCVPRACDAES